MAKWDIDVAAARGIISSTETQYASLARLKRELTSTVDSASTACRSTVIGTALDQVRGASLADPTQQALDQAGTATSSTAAAVEHYQQGDLTMAANANTKAGEAPDAGY